MVLVLATHSSSTSLLSRYIHKQQNNHQKNDLEFLNIHHQQHLRHNSAPHGTTIQHNAYISHNGLVSDHSLVTYQTPVRWVFALNVTAGRQVSRDGGQGKERGSLVSDHPLVIYLSRNQYTYWFFDGGIFALGVTADREHWMDRLDRSLAVDRLIDR